MRHSLTVILGLFLASCTTVIVDGSGSGNAGSAGSVASTTPSDTFPASCDGHGDCGACFDCAVNGECADETATCIASETCAALLDCLAQCPDDDDICLGDCYNAYPPEAADLVIDFRVCINCVCAVDCVTGC